MIKRVLDVLDVQGENGAMTPTSRRSFSSWQARKESGSVLDVAEHGGVVTVNRGKTRSTVVSEGSTVGEGLTRSHLPLCRTPARTPSTLPTAGQWAAEEEFSEVIDGFMVMPDY